MKKFVFITLLAFSAAVLCVNQGHSQFSTVNAVSSYNSADTTPMKKTMKKTTHKITKKTMKSKSDSTKG